MHYKGASPNDWIEVPFVSADARLGGASHPTPAAGPAQGRPLSVSPSQSPPPDRSERSPEIPRERSPETPVEALKPTKKRKLRKCKKCMRAKKQKKLELEAYEDSEETPRGEVRG
jgi:hypothetical protein